MHTGSPAAGRKAADITATRGMAAPPGLAMFARILTLSFQH